jgi:hypothetical protein
MDKITLEEVWEAVQRSMEKKSDPRPHRDQTALVNEHAGSRLSAWMERGFTWV